MILHPLAFSPDGWHFMDRADYDLALKRIRMTELEDLYGLLDDAPERSARPVSTCEVDELDRLVEARPLRRRAPEPTVELLRLQAALGLQPCGTHAAFNRHTNAGEDPCSRCEDGEREYQRARYLRRKKNNERSEAA